MNDYDRDDDYDCCHNDIEYFYSNIKCDDCLKHYYCGVCNKLYKKIYKKKNLIIGKYVNNYKNKNFYLKK